MYLKLGFGSRLLHNYIRKIIENVKKIKDRPLGMKNLITLPDYEGKVIFGSTVKLQDLETNKEITYKLVGQDEADIKKNLIFFKSPIGKALVGKDKGEMVIVKTPSGEKNFEILDVEYI